MMCPLTGSASGKKRLRHFLLDALLSMCCYRTGRLRAWAKAIVNNNVGSGWEAGRQGVRLPSLGNWQAQGLGLLTVISQFCFMNVCPMKTSTPRRRVAVKHAAEFRDRNYTKDTGTLNRNQRIFFSPTAC